MSRFPAVHPPPRAFSKESSPRSPHRVERRRASRSDCKTHASWQREPMSQKAPRLFCLESPFPESASMLRFLEPPDTCANALWERLFSGDYDKPFIVDVRLRRFLHFDFDAVQSAMDLVRPERLCLAY